METAKQAAATASSLPPLIVAEEQFDDLSGIAERLSRVLPEVSGFLERELARAKLMPMAQVPGDVVTMNATVEFIFGMKGRPERLKLVYPARTMPESGCISLASPAGVALLGMREGETISWSTRYGDMRWLKVVKVCGRVSGD
ncbi:MAG: GreA/GreB family elongation factor [Parvibaculaceae bacterium]